MFLLDLPKIYGWVTMALLVLCCSIGPNSGYPQVEEDEDEDPYLTPEENPEDVDSELVHNDDENWDEEDGQEDFKGEKGKCKDLGEQCGPKYKGAVPPKCCGDNICHDQRKVCTAKD